MSNYQIVRAGERINDIISGGETVARVINGDNGWMAFKVVKTDRFSAMGPVYQPVGDGVKANKLINRSDAAIQILAALGL